MTTVKAPAWKWEFNINTIVILFGFAGGLIAWGSTWERVNANQKAHAESIERLDRRLTTVELSFRQLDNHELRLSAVEKQATEAASSMRAVETTLNNLSSDMRLVREILQRIEDGSQRPRTRTP